MGYPQRATLRPKTGPEVAVPQPGVTEAGSSGTGLPPTGARHLGAEPADTVCCTWYLLCTWRTTSLSGFHGTRLGLLALLQCAPH